MKQIRSAQLLTALLLLALSSGHALADGGIIRLRETQGPFVITIFTASEPVRNTPVDVSVMVQKADSSEAILDATVELALTAPALDWLVARGAIMRFSRGAGARLCHCHHPGDPRAGFGQVVLPRAGSFSTGARRLDAQSVDRHWCSNGGPDSRHTYWLRSCL
jgi:hypothetical protein